MPSFNGDDVAAFPMYEFDALRSAHDGLWSAVAAHLMEAGIARVPARLSRERDYREIWRDPRLLLGQGCEFPLATTFAGSVRVVAVPHYGVPGCEGARYSSAIVVASGDAAVELADLRNRRCVINAVDSNSGMNLLRSTIAPLMNDGGRGKFFQSVTVSGAHRLSAQMIVDAKADVAALDCVSFAHLKRLYPDMMAGLRVLGWTPTSPALPYITARSTSDATVVALRGALQAAMTNPALSEVRAALSLVDVDVDIDADSDFAEVLRLEREAVARGYPILV